MITYQHKVTGGGCLNNTKELAIMEAEGWQMCGIGFSSVYWKRENTIKHQPSLTDTEIENLANKFSATIIPKWTSGFVTGFKECYAMFFNEKKINETPKDGNGNPSISEELKRRGYDKEAIPQTIELTKLNTFFKFWNMWHGHPSVGSNIEKAFENWTKPDNQAKPTWIVLDDNDIVAAWWNLLKDEDKEAIAYRWFDRTKVFPDGIKRYQIEYLHHMETKHKD